MSATTPPRALRELVFSKPGDPPPQGDDIVHLVEDGFRELLEVDTKRQSYVLIAALSALLRFAERDLMAEGQGRAKQ